MTDDAINRALALSFEPEPDSTQMSPWTNRIHSQLNCWVWIAEAGRADHWQPRDFLDPDLTVMMLEWLVDARWSTTVHIYGVYATNLDKSEIIRAGGIRSVSEAIREACARARGAWKEWPQPPTTPYH